MPPHAAPESRAADAPVRAGTMLFRQGFLAAVSTENGGRVLLETHVLQWPETLGPEGAYGKIVRVELLHKLHDERAYPSLDALREGIAQDVRDARAWIGAQHAETRRQTTRDRI